MISNAALSLDFKCIFPYRDGRLNGLVNLVKYQLKTLKTEVDLHSHGIVSAILNDACVLSLT